MQNSSKLNFFKLFKTEERVNFSVLIYSKCFVNVKDLINRHKLQISAGYKLATLRNKSVEK